MRRIEITNRIRKQFDKARKLYTAFSGHKAEPLAQIEKPTIPDVGIVIGYCDGLLYTTVREGEVEEYIHEFRKADRPLFVVSPNGDQLLLIGGNYDFTDRGIVDRSDTKNRR